MIEAGAKLSGKVWLDLNRDRLHQGGNARWPAGARAAAAASQRSGRARPARVVTGPGTQYRLIQGGRDRRRRRLPHADVTPREDYALRFLSPSGYRYATPVDGDNGAAQSTRGPMPTRACW